MVTYPSLRRQEKRFQHLSGMSVAEFDELYRRFERAWTRAEEERLQRRTRQRAPGAGNEYKLDLDTRLLLCLVWMRHYLTTEAVGLLFDVSQATASRNIARIIPVLHSLAVASLQPPTAKGARRSFLDLKAEQPDLFAIVDATEQSINRPQDDEQARLHFSGKQRRSTLKTTLHVNEDSLIRQISATTPGSMHDVTQLRQSGLLRGIAPDAITVADAGYVGIYKDLPEQNVLVPYKAQRNHPLVAEQRYANNFISSIRIKIENVFAQLKIFRILSHRFRHRRATLHTAVFTIIAALTNARTLNRLKHAWLAA